MEQPRSRGVTICLERGFSLCSDHADARACETCYRQLHSVNAAALKFNVIPIIVGIIGLLTAFVLGMFIGGGEMFNLALIFGTVTLILVMAGMRQHVWLLIPLFWSFVGSVAVLPVPFSVRDLVVMFVAALSFALLALRIYRFHNRWGLLDFLLLLNVAQVVSAFVAHPTGLRALSSESVGAR